MKNAALIIVAACLCMPFSAFAASMTLTATVKLPSICGNGIREDGEQCDGADLGGASCGMLGYSGGSLSCTPSCTFSVSSCTTAADSVFLNTFPVSGGTYRFTNPDATEVGLTVAPNSATDTLQLISFVYATSTEATSSLPGGTFVGRVYDLFFVSSDGNMVHSLANPVTIILPYSDADVAGLDPDTIAAYRKENGESEWHEVSGSFNDPAAHTVTFTTGDFSSFAIAGEPPAPAPAPGSMAYVTQSITGSVSRAVKWFMAPIVAVKSLLAPKPPKTPGDVNGDGIVDLGDFSVMAYWYGRPNPPKRADLNGDGIVDLADFSILAHYWSGKRPS